MVSPRRAHRPGCRHAAARAGLNCQTASAAIIIPRQRREQAALRAVLVGLPRRLVHTVDLLAAQPDKLCRHAPNLPIDDRNGASRPVRVPATGSRRTRRHALRTRRVRPIRDDSPAGRGRRRPASGADRATGAPPPPRPRPGAPAARGGRHAGHRHGVSAGVRHVPGVADESRGTGRAEQCPGGARPHACPNRDRSATRAPARRGASRPGGVHDAVRGHRPGRGSTAPKRRATAGAGRDARATSDTRTTASGRRTSGPRTPGACSASGSRASATGAAGGPRTAMGRRASEYHGRERDARSGCHARNAAEAAPAAEAAAAAETAGRDPSTATRAASGRTTAATTETQGPLAGRKAGRAGALRAGDTMEGADARSGRARAACATTHAQTRAATAAAPRSVTW